MHRQLRNAPRVHATDARASVHNCLRNQSLLRWNVRAHGRANQFPHNQICLDPQTRGVNAPNTRSVNACERARWPR